MKKVMMYLLLVLFVSIIAISGCSSKDVQDDFNGDVEENVKPSVEENVVDDNDDSSDNGADASEVNGGIPSDVVKLLEKSKDKLRNIKYEHRRFPNNQELHIISILGDKIVYILPESQAFFKDEYFDTVYMDISERSAVAYCEHKGDQKCPHPNKEFDVEFDDYIGMIIYDGWIDKIINGKNYVKRDQETLFDRKVDVFDVDIEGFEYPHEISQNPQKSTLNKTENSGYSKSSINGVTHRISVDQFYGVPMKIEKYPDSDVDGNRPAEEYTYRIISVDKLESNDIKHKVVPE